MSARLGTLTLDLVAKTGSFLKGTEKSRKAVQKFAKDSRKAMNSMGKGFLAASTVAVGALTVVINKQRELIDTQAKLAQELNTTYTSLSNLERAGGLAGVGFDKITTAGRMLNLNIGKAIGGIKAQADAFDRLGLSAQDIADMPLDKRIVAINKALKDNVRQAERASVAADIFGAKNGSIIQMLSGDVIDTATEQVKLFGLALSDVDAAKVENANDAFSTIRLMADGVQKQLTIALIPAVQAVGDMFLETNKDAGGLGTAVADAVKIALKGLAFVVDAVDGVKRVFSIVSDSIIAGFNAIFSLIVGGLASTLEAASKLPGIDFSNTVSSLNEFSRISASVANQAMDNIKETFESPLAGSAFLDYYDKAVAKSTEAAEAVVAGREAEKKASEESAKAAAEALLVEEKRKELAEQRVVDMEAYADLVKSQRTDSEQELDTLREKLGVLEAIKFATDIDDNEKKEQRSRAIAGAFTSDAPGLGEDETGLFDKLDSQQKAQEKWYESELEKLKEFRENKLITEEEYDELDLERKKQHEEAMGNIEKARRDAALSGVSDLFGSIATATENGTKKQRKIAKAAAIAQATINTYLAAQSAYASAAQIPIVGWIAGPIAAAAAVAAGLANISKIKGQAHDGIDYVPTSGTWNLEKGERVVTNKTSKKLDATLDEIRGGSTTNNSSRNSNVTNNITLVGGDDGRRTASQIANETMTRQQIAQARFG